MITGMKPPISSAILNRLESSARLPVKSPPPPGMVSFWADVMELKRLAGGEKLKKTTRWKGSETEAWQRVRAALDSAMNERDFAFLDAFAEAWGKIGRPEHVFPFTYTEADGKVISENAIGPPDNKSREPLSVKIIVAIGQIQAQQMPDRAPTRRELLAFLSKRGVALDDGDLCRQLTKMKLTRLLNTAKNLAS